MFFLKLLINPISQLVSSVLEYLEKREDVKLEKYRIDGKYDIAHIQALAEVAKLRSSDIVDKCGRWLFIFPTGVYYAAVLYDSTFRELLPQYTWRVLALPEEFKYWAGAVLGYLLVTTWRNKRY